MMAYHPITILCRPYISNTPHGYRNTYMRKRCRYAQLLYNANTFNDHRRNTLKASNKSKNLFSNWKILRELVVDNENSTQNLPVTEPQFKGRGDNGLNKKDFIHYSFNLDIEKNKLLCPLLPSNLGPVVEDKDIMNLYGLDDMVLHVQLGGIYRPLDCISRQKIAIIAVVHETHVQVRNFIGSFLYYMHPFLMKQQIEYQIFIVVKANAIPPFKRGELYNVGFEAVQTYYNKSWDCVIFHDIYIVPLDTRNLYRCSQRPKKLIDFGKRSMFGGVVAMKPAQFVLVNGFSNLAWSRNDDYEDMYKRLIAANFTVEANKSPIANYTTIDYLKQMNNESLQSPTVAPGYLKDGLSNLPSNISEILFREFYTLVEVNIET